jgi:hypothetical protein
MAPTTPLAPLTTRSLRVATNGALNCGLPCSNVQLYTTEEPARRGGPLNFPDQIAMRLAAAGHAHETMP